MDKLTSEEQAEFDALLKKIVRKPEENGFEVKLTNFLNEQLNPILVFGVMNKYKKVQGYELLDDLPEHQQKKFATTIIEKLFSRIRSNEEVEAIKQTFFHQTDA